MEGVSLLAGLTGSLVAAGIAEFRRHRRHLSQIPTRIHVNGTRGKSSVTRLIAAGLRAAGIRTFAKTTGSTPRMILPDGSEVPVNRNGRANVIEQVGVVQEACRHRAEALVLECMALQPHLQWLCEDKLVRATHGVITNARPDHLDVMGPTPDDVASALAGMAPTRGILFSGQRSPVFSMAASDRGSLYQVLRRRDIEKLSRQDLARFRYIEHADNVALSLLVCEQLGVSRDVALPGMWSADPDPGAMTVTEVVRGVRRICFINAFAANDPESTRLIADLVQRRFGSAGPFVMLINCRADRAERTLQLAQLCAEQDAEYFLVGTGTELFRQAVVSRGVASEAVTRLEGCCAEEVADHLFQRAKPSALVLGVGNISGPGFEIVDFLTVAAQRWDRRPILQIRTA